MKISVALYDYAFEYILLGVGAIILLLFGIALWGLYCSLRPRPTNDEPCR